MIANISMAVGSEMAPPSSHKIYKEKYRKKLNIAIELRRAIRGHHCPIVSNLIVMSPLRMKESNRILNFLHNFGVVFIFSVQASLDRQGNGGNQ